MGMVGVCPVRNPVIYENIKYIIRIGKTFRLIDVILLADIKIGEEFRRNAIGRKIPFVATKLFRNDIDPFSDVTSVQD
jgi:hypothetical protein